MKMNVMKRTITLFSIVLLGILAIPAYAHQNSTMFNAYDRIEKRLDIQHNRIRNGINSGALTRKEVRRLRKQQRYIMHLTHRFMVNGYLDRYEISELRDALERASQRIYRLKHNGRNRQSRYYY